MEDKDNIEKEFDPELALAAQNAKAEMEARQNEEGNEEINVGEEEIIVAGEPMEQEEENGV